MLQAGDRYAGLKDSIQAVYERHKGRYGYRRITAELGRGGQIVNHKTVQRLMQSLGLKSLVRPKRYRSYRGEMAATPNLLNRRFEAERPNEKWVTDVTEFNVRGKKLYLSPVMDLFNGEIVAYEMNERPLFPLVGNMLKKALSRLTAQEAPMMHSDQGWQGGFNRSSQHLQSGGVCGTTRRMDEAIDGERGNALSWCAVASA